MEIAAEMFEQIVAALGPARDEAVPPGAAERRRDRRVAVNADVFVAPFGVASARPRKVKLRSISRGGAAIVDEFTRPPGVKVVLYLPGPDGGLLPIVCQVMNSRMSGAAFRVGMQFLGQSEQLGAQVTRNVRAIVNNVAVESPLQVLERIATHGVTRDGPERPVELNVQGVMTRDAAADAQPGPATFVTVKDIATSGCVGVLHDGEMRKGERFVLQIPSQAKPLRMLCTVVESRRVDEGSVRIVARFELPPDGAAGAGLLGRMRRWFAA
jgi:hypothetical protein